VSSSSRSGGRRQNRLAGETSPYLLQHVHNPVDWHPWGEEALERARNEDRPIFLSIGYAACHWCHVMERESFEDPATADLLNGHFVPIKVDREERPDIDAIYMNAVQLMTGHGGWPLSVFLTPDLEPFMGGTYFPPDDRHGIVGFRTVLARIRDAWAERRAEIDRTAGRLAEHLREIARGVVGGGGERLGRREVLRAAAELTARFDSRWGGFGPAPKFPSEGALELLLDEHVRGGESVPLQVVDTSLERMARGGIYDHVGGGFARYSVDERWLVPHFEKMLYNQALLVPLYADAWLLTGKPFYRRVVEQTLDFVRREMTSPGGGFYSSLDADSEGVEGKFYVWTPEEVGEVLGEEDARLFCSVYGVTPVANFEGRSIPNLLDESLAEYAARMGLDESDLTRRLDVLLERLLDARDRRVRPATDDKILTAWNGLMIGATARAHQACGRPEDLVLAMDSAEFALAHLVDGDRLRVTWRDGRAKLNAYLDDHAFLARGLLDLYETCFDVRYLEWSIRIARTMLDRFEDSERGGFFFTSDDHESLLARTRSQHDGALPAGVGVATEVLLRLGVHSGEERFRLAAERTLEVFTSTVGRGTSAFASLLLASTRAEEPPVEVAIVGSPDERATRELLAVVRGRYRARPAIQCAEAGADPGPRKLLEGKSQVAELPTAYVCRNYACARPVTEPADLARELGD
jgi:uncharacterized protein YyaL (SSP411 family)